jgi:hypothetical protein
MQSFGKMLILVGGLTVLLGIVLMFSDKLPFLGKLPGDIHIRRENFEFHFPIVTSLLLSIVISLILWIVSQFRGR